MVWVAGADGCHKGWFRVLRETASGELRFHRLSRAAELLTVPPTPSALGLDIPIGLPERGPRECDRRARACLGRPRSSSVFPAPIRPALHASSREEASRITQSRDGRRVSAQAWALYPKVRAVDDLLTDRPQARRAIREVHPEVSFWAWNRRRALAQGKRTRAGSEQRLKLVRAWLGSDFLSAARAAHPGRDVGDDDILDAVAALWTAIRIVEGSAARLPEEPPLDATGLPMQIVY